MQTVCLRNSRRRRLFVRAKSGGDAVPQPSEDSFFKPRFVNKAASLAGDTVEARGQRSMR
jgi:hypothetical protein